MAKWICIKPVTYGRRDYSPDAIDEKSRAIILPAGVAPDQTIETYFELEGTPEVKPATATQLPEPMPDLLKKLEKEALEDAEKIAESPLEKKQAELKAKFRKKRR